MFTFHAYFYIYSYSMYKRATSVTEGEVAGVKLVEAPLITDRSKAVVLMWSLLAVLVSDFR